MSVTNGTLTLNGTWSSSGTLSIDNSTLNLGGAFNLAGLNLPGFTRVGGTVNLTGTVTNTASTLTLNNSTGSWVLNGGTLSGGTLAFADGQNLLIGVANNNLLTGMTVNGDLILSTIASRVKIAGGTTFNTAHLAGTSTSIGFAPSQTLNGTILFEGAPGGTRAVEINGTGGHLHHRRHRHHPHHSRPCGQQPNRWRLQFCRQHDAAQSGTHQQPDQRTHGDDQSRHELHQRGHH
jgi:hypothetical protein